MKKILLGFIAIGLLTFVGCGTSSSVKIGEQEWMSKNLNVDHFRNGDIILEAKTDEEWEKAGKENRPAWCYYDNDISNGEKYGKLYNWYAVNDPRGLAPEGWQVPTDSEWTVLTIYLSADGHDGKEGTALKATSGWGSGRNGTDDYEWNGLPGGSRFHDDSFIGIGGLGDWWSSSQFSASRARIRSLAYFNGGLIKGRGSKENGFSVRCLRD